LIRSIVYAMIGPTLYRQRGNDMQMALRRATMRRVLQTIEDPPNATVRERTLAVALPDDWESVRTYATRMMEPARGRRSLWAQLLDTYFTAAFLGRTIIIVWKDGRQQHHRADIYPPDFTHIRVLFIFFMVISLS